MRWFVDKLNTFRFAATIATLIGLASLSYFSLLRLHETTRQVRQAQQILEQTEIVISRLKDAETGQRGYLLTGKEKYLEPYYASVTTIDQEIDKLAQLVSADPRQQSRLIEIQSLVQAKLAELQQTIELRQTQGIAASLQVVNTDRGKQLMERLRQVSGTIKTEQQDLFNQRSRYEEQNSEYVTYLTLGSIALQILLITGITFRLNQEGEALQRSRVDLLQSEERYRSLVTAMTQVVWIADVRGNLLSVSSAWQVITGQTEQEAQGWGWFNTIHPDDRESVRQAWQRAIAEQTLYEVECRLCLPQGGCRSFLVRGIPVLEADHRVREWVGTYVDITERKHVESALRESRDILEVWLQEQTQELTAANAELQAEINERKQIEQQLEQSAASLQQSNQELERFAYIASHDLQEPLRTIASYTQLLAKKYEGQLDEKADKYIGYVVDGATRMQQLINDLLTYSRVGRQTLNLNLIDCNAVIGRVHATMQTAIAESHALITVEPLPEIIADVAQLTQLFQNLISNAIKYRAKDPPTIHIAATQTDEEWIFSVKDNGIGIDSQYADRIFVIFQRLHTRREYAGTGVGLAICRKIIELHKGRIWVESQLGQGSTFYFSLPRDNLASTIDLPEASIALPKGA